MVLLYDTKAKATQEGWTNLTGGRQRKWEYVVLAHFDSNSRPATRGTAIIDAIRMFNNTANRRIQRAPSNEKSRLFVVL